jgi:hypothetical protein
MHEVKNLLKSGPKHSNAKAGSFFDKIRNLIF